MLFYYHFFMYSTVTGYNFLNTQQFECMYDVPEYLFFKIKEVFKQIY